MAAQRGARAIVTRVGGSRPYVRGLRVILGVVAAALAVAVYWNALDNPFVYDDRDTVLLNPSLVDLSNVRLIFLFSPFRPAVNASYAIDRAFWGMTPFGFHITNVALHATVVALFYGFCTRALSDAGRPEADATWPAFFAAAVYAVHPLMTEAAGYISGRSELLCAVGVLAALIFARSAILHGSHARAVAAAAGAVLAFTSNETAIALPFVLMAYDRWVLRGARWRRRVTRVYLPLVGALAVVGALRLWALWSVAPTMYRSPVDTLLTQAIVIWRYVGLLLLPTRQTIMHDVRFVSTQDVVAAIGALAALAALVAVASWAIRRCTNAPLVALGVTWFLVVLAPSSSVVALRQGMAEHRVYLASGGFFLGLAGILGPALARQVSARAAATVVIVVCGVLTLQRNVIWADPLALWGEAAAGAPGMWEPHFAYADALREAGQCPRAIDEYEAVLRLRPQHRDAVTNLGICLAQTGRPDEAERAFRRGLEIDPRWARGYTDLGALAIAQRKYEAARHHYEDALRVDPQNVLARMQLAQLDESVFHDYHAAARMCGEARALAPSTPGVIECVQRNQQLAARAAAR